MSEVCIETARLKLVPSTMRWREELFGLFNEPEVSDWLFLTGPPTREQLDRRLEFHEQFWRDNGFGMFVVLEKPTDRFVARVGPMVTPETGRIEVAWSTTRDAWGRGYASEAARASVEFTFANSKLAELDCYLRPDNTGSRRVAEKVGFRYRDTRFVYDRPLRFYQMPRKT
ncbi:MAG: GNAT family N-acetyltransferase [Micropepsaceae bacterium]